MFVATDPLGNRVTLSKATLFGHIYRRHPELRKKISLILEAVSDPDSIAQSKKDGVSLLYFKQARAPLILMVVGTPNTNSVIIRTSFYVLNTSKGDPIIWRKKIST